MSRKAKMSVLGLYSYDSTLFDGLLENLPTYTDEDEVEHTLDGDVLRDNILLECAELEVVYPDPEFCKQAITVWSKMRAGVWQELYDTMFYVYDPIENYNRVEHWADDFTHGHKVTMDVKDTTTNSVTGYNDTNLSDRDKTVFENDDTETHSGKDSNVRDGYARGNIGVTTTQQMIDSQRETVMFNLYETILQEFRERFCLLVY